MRFHEILTEMVVHGSFEGDGTLVVAFGGNIWLFNRSDDSHDAEKFSEIADVTGIRADDVEDLEQIIADRRPDVLCGTIWNDRLHLSSLYFLGHEPTSSPLIHKTVKQLGLSGVDAEVFGEEDTETISHHKSSLLGRLPEVVYHGTCTRYMPQIERYGIRPTSNANWTKEAGKFRGLVFLAASPAIAAFHANRQAKTLHCAPVVIATRLPDLSKVEIDYDIAVAYSDHSDPRFERNGYAKGMASLTPFLKKQYEPLQQYNKNRDATKMTGIFAYRGRIPASYFTTIYSTLADTAIDPRLDYCFSFDSRAEFTEALSMYDDLGFYDPSFERESLDDEED